MSKMDKKSMVEEIKSGQTTLGIELGSTRIKGVLVDSNYRTIASGGFGWENQFIDGIWSYSLEEVWTGVQACVSDLQKNLQAEYGIPLESPAAIGISGMMHGYMVFDKEANQLVPFRTWRNNITGEAAEELTELFQYPIPQRWSIAHLYQAILNGESHVNQIAHITTLAGYVHWRLTGEQVMGIGEASGMFPIDIQAQNFNAEFAQKLDGHLEGKDIPWKILDIFPRVLGAGDAAGTLTEEGAGLLDPTGNIKAGVPFCPPEGDAGTGMVATNSVKVRTGNVSAGTSVFAMLVLEKDLSKLQRDIDLVTTPDGKLVAMAHSNNCTSDIDAWVELLGQAAEALGLKVSSADLYQKLLPKALEGDADAGGLLSYGYLSGEHVTGFSEGRPLFVRSPDSTFNLPNFMRAHLFTSLCALRTGLNILFEEEGVQVEEIRGHGGFFKSAAGQSIMAAATKTPISTLETAGEGGAYGIALLAAYSRQEKEGASLPEFLDSIFAGSIGQAVEPNPDDVEGFEVFFRRYQVGLPIEQAAVDHLK